MIKDLTEFSPPESDKVTLCEVDGRLRTVHYKAQNINTFTTAIEKHPEIHIFKDTLHSKSNDEFKEIFLPVEVSTLKHLAEIYHEHGFVEMLENAAVQRQYFVSKPALLLLKVVQALDEFRSLFNPHLKKETKALMNAISRTRNWSSSPVRCLSWNPYSKRIAVALFDDTVKIFYNGSNAVTSLKVKKQKNIMCLAWRPMCISDLAVGCEEGIVIWSIDPTLVVARPSSSCATYLHKLEHRPIVSLTWSPHGDILISAAAYDSQIQVWDVEMNKSSMLKRHGPAGNTIVEYSPSGNKLFSSSVGAVFRVWEIRNWEPERWNLLTGRVQAACWSPCGAVLLFSSNDEPMIYSVSFLDADLVFASNSRNSANKATPLFDLTKRELDGVIVGGVVRNMVIDPKGKHLAILFQETNYIAVFNVIMQPTLQLTASCFVSGLPEEIPNAIDFEKNFEDGACLTIAWSGGRVQHFPIIYTDLTNHLASSHNQQSFYTSFTSDCL